MEMFIGFHTYIGYNTLLIVLPVGTVYCEAASNLSASMHTNQLAKSHMCACVSYIWTLMFFLYNNNNLFSIPEIH
jgi:hypothetical protein